MVRDMLKIPKCKPLTGDEVMGLNRLIAGMGTLAAFRYLSEPRMFSGWWPSILTWLAGAVAILILVAVTPRHRKLVRGVALVLDTLGTTLIMGAGSSATAYAFVAYFWVIIGYGFRFGVSWLGAASVFSILGFCLVWVNDSFWLDHSSLSLGLLSSLAVLPAYSFALIRRLEKARTEAEQANVAKSLFLAGVSHELRTPLHAIIGTAEGLQQTRLTEEQKGLIATINGAAAGQLSLVQDLLEYSRTDAGDQRSVEVPVEISSLLEDVTAVTEATARGRGLLLNYHITGRTPLLYAGDKRRIREVLLNLCSNAIRFTTSGSVTISADCIGMQGSTAQVRFEVADTGIGIHPREHDRIFELFTQAFDKDEADLGGTGLGLALCKRLVLMMNGKIGVESMPGAGSSFWFIVPLECADEPVMAGAALSASAATGSPDWFRSLSNALTERMLNKETNPRIALIHDMPQPDAQQQTKAAIYLSQSDPGLPPRWAREQCMTTVCSHSSSIEITRALHIAALWIQRRQAQVSGAASHPGQALAGELKGARVLVADDNKVNRSILQRMLDKAGADVVMANDGEQALSMLTGGDLDIALIDVQMPLMDGIEVAQFYAFSMPVQRQIPLLALTADSSPETEAKCLRVGFKRCLVKPIKPSDLLLILKEELADDPATEVQGNDPPVIVAPALDLGTYSSLEALIGKPGMLQLVEEFKQDGDATVGRIGAALKGGDLAGFRFESHTLASMAGNMGGRYLAALCSTWSRMPEDEFARAPRIVPPQLRWEWGRTCNALAEQALHHIPDRRSAR